jgi:hypothetical protein
VFHIKRGALPLSKQKRVKKLRNQKPSSPNKRRKTPFHPLADEMILEELIRMEKEELNKKR